MNLILFGKLKLFVKTDILLERKYEEVTVKIFFCEDGHFRLQPENRDFKPIITSQLEILGTVVKLIRDYK